MTSVGVMASSVVTATYTDILLDAFENRTNWTNVTGSSNPTIVTGRTANGMRVSGANPVYYSIPSGNQSDTLTIGFAYKVDSLSAGTIEILWLYSDTVAGGGGTAHNALQVLSTGALRVDRSAGGTVLGTTAAGVITVNTFYYIELQATLHDTAGTVIVRVNGTERLNLSAVDTKNAGTKTVYDSIRCACVFGTNNVFDDMYVTVGAGAPFKGSITIP